MPCRLAVCFSESRALKMASSSISSTLNSSTFPYCPSNSSLFTKPPSPASLLSFTHALKPFPPRTKSLAFHQNRDSNNITIVKAQTLDFSGSFFEGGFGSDEDPPSTTGSGMTSVVEDKEPPPCPPGLRQYETMAVLRSDMSEDERLALTQKYEELLVAGGGMYVEVFNRGVVPLAYGIRKKNKAGETNTYLDGIYLLFTYFTKPESMGVLEEVLNADDDVIRSMTFKIRKRKY